jgi:hypothetical protein
MGHAVTPEPPPPSTTSAIAAPARGGRTRPLFALGLILAVGLALRAFDLGGIPPGLWSDEALNGIDAWGVWNGGGFQLVYPDVFPREPILVSLLALAVKIGGPQIIVLRAVPVLIGTLTILALYLMLRREAGEDTALIAAGMLATMRWHALMSRLVFRTIVLPLWIVLLVWAVLAYRRRPSTPRAILVGVFIGGGFYTYLAWYFMLPFVAGLVLWTNTSPNPKSEIRNPKRIQHSHDPGTDVGPIPQSAIRIPHFFVVFGAALSVMAPLAVTYVRQPDLLLSRPGAVSVFSAEGGGWGEIAQNAGEALLMFHGRGDHVEQQNIPHATALNRIQRVAFLLGLVFCGISIWRRSDHALPVILSAWLACGLLPTIFTYTDSPNFLRTLVAAPAVAAIAGLGLANIGRRLAKRAGSAVAIATIALILFGSAVWTGLQLREWGALPGVRAKYQADVIEMGAIARRLGDDRTGVLIPAMFQESLPLRFQLIGARNVRFFDDWSFLAPWSPSGNGRFSTIGRRFIFYPAGSTLPDRVRRLIPTAALYNPMGDLPGPRIVGGAVVVSEQLLPPAEVLDRLRAGRL